MSKPRIAIASLGGTITMVSNAGGATGVRPRLNVDDLVSTAPSIADVASLKTETLATMPGASLEPKDLHRALEWARQAVLEGVDGVVLVQGTDSIEESAYLLDLYWDRPEPLVITGAMRSPETPGFDGPANLLASVLTAASAGSRELGVLAVMNDEVHAASRVRKMRASGVSAFSSPNFGPLAYVEEGRVVHGNTLTRFPPLPLTGMSGTSRVALLETHLGDDGTLLSLAREAGFDGIVVAGYGVGHVSALMADAVSTAIECCPVVLSSRTGGGTTFDETYGFTGSESDLIARGAIAAGWLDPRKARILLNCLIAGGNDRSAIQAQFSLRGGSRAKL
ncbi:MAG: asparaginase [Cryobacterium sp.]|jgi:L-asparaginase|nr:asparaginase [Cryobacterium sp.]